MFLSAALRPELLQSELLCWLLCRGRRVSSFRVFQTYLDDGVPIINRGELLEEALGDERREGNVLSVFLHLFLSILRTLEGEVLQPGQHPPPGVDSADQLVGGAERDGEGQVLGVVPGPQAGHEASGTLQPAHYLETLASRELGVCNNILFNNL